MVRRLTGLPIIARLRVVVRWGVVLELDDGIGLEFDFSRKPLR